MKLTKLFIIGCIVFFGGLYIVTSFIELQFNPVLWTYEARTTVGVLFFLASIIFTAAIMLTIRDLAENEKQRPADPGNKNL